MLAGVVPAKAVPLPLGLLGSVFLELRGSLPVEASPWTASIGVALSSL
jgi:hypothetical protein